MTRYFDGRAATSGGRQKEAGRQRNGGSQSGQGSDTTDKECGVFRAVTAQSDALTTLITRGLATVPGKGPLCVLQARGHRRLPAHPPTR